GRRRVDAWEQSGGGGGDVCVLHVVAVALLVAVQIGDVAGDQYTLDVVPGAGADAVARVHARRIAALFLAEIGAPGFGRVRSAQGLRLLLAHLVGASEAAQVAGLVGVVGNEEAYVRRRCGRLLLGLRQQRCRSQKSDGSDGKNDRSSHCSYLPFITGSTRSLSFEP